MFVRHAAASSEDLEFARVMRETYPGGCCILLSQPYDTDEIPQGIPQWRGEEQEKGQT